MEIRPLHFIARACAGRLVKGSMDASVLRVCTDSRLAQPGDLFFALRGERFDAHQFVPEVARKAAAVVVDQWSGSVDTADAGVVLVDDTRRALGRLAAAYRQQFPLPVVAVAGSNGKTTTKEIVAAVLQRKLRTLWSEASYNNDVGVPLTLLRLDASHEAAVLEAGTNHPGELEPLVRMMSPRYGVVTSIGREHLEFFGDLAGVAREEGVLGEWLPADGKLFLNVDNDLAETVAARSRAPVVRIGLAPNAHWRAVNLRSGKRGTTFAVQAPDPRFAGDYRVALIGRRQAVNALFAIALGAELGLTREEVQVGLSQCKPPRMRLDFWEHGGVGVLDDAYNANADSMIAALETLQDLPCKGRRIAVLGDMAELGPHSDAAHEEVGRRAAELGIGQLISVGKMAPVMARGARSAGLNRVMEFADVDAAADAVKRLLRQGDLVLLKASRAMRLERVAERLRQNGN